MFIVGGTGFLGQAILQEFLKTGWRVTCLGLPPAPPRELYPGEVTIILRDFEQAPSEELLTILRGHDAIVFAAGADDRAVHKRPVYPFFHHKNVEAAVRMLTLAGQAGICRGVVLGSYFTYFDRLWPEMRLAEYHPYIRSRVEQQKAVTNIPGLEVCVLELPYIFGYAHGRKSLWRPLIKYLRASPILFYMQGGTACISARTVGRAVVGAIEHAEAGKFYPIGQENLTWSQMLGRLARADGRHIRVVTLPTWILHIGLQALWLSLSLRGKESGLDPRHFASLQTAETFLNPEPAQRLLGFEPDSLDEAFKRTLVASD